MTDLIFFAFIVLFLVWMVELGLSATWNRIYFTIGLPIFIRRVPVSGFRVTLLNTGLLETEFSASFLYNSLVFKELDDCIYAFRDKLVEVHWYRKNSTNLMHCVLILDKTGHEVIVKGYANWVIILLLPVIAVMGISVSSVFWWGVPIGLAAAGIGYVFETKRYGKVAEKAVMLAAASRRPASGEFG